MAKITDVAAYICEHYPHKDELSKARLTKLVYLADWKAAQRLKRQMTGIRWYFHNFGPYVDDVIEAVSVDSRFSVDKTTNYYGDEKTIIRFSPRFSANSVLSAEEQNLIDEVIEETRKLYWGDFIKHVYDTAPIARSVRHTYLDLVGLVNAA